MTAISSYARARAVAAGRAQPITTVRHLHMAARPMVFVPLVLAGEANAPLAAMVGTSEQEPSMLVVPQPRNRDHRFAFAAQLTDIIVPYVESFTHQTEQTRNGVRFTDAPQLLVPNPGGIGFVRLFGRSTRFRRTEGEYAVAPGVPVLGRWLTYLAERAEHPGSSMLVALTNALGLHWATGQSSLEDANLAAAMAWIDPPAGITGPEAARVGEDPLVWPPAGPATDPVYDNEVLAPAIRAYDEAPAGSLAQDRALAVLNRALEGQLEPTWRLMWRAIARLRELPPGDSVAQRWAEERQQFTNFVEYVNGGGLPQARRDGAVAAARRLNRLEHEQANYDAERAFDDPVVMANHRITGEAFVGTVVEVDRDRRVPNDKGNLVTRPLVTVHTEDPVYLSLGTEVVAVSRRNQHGSIASIDGQEGGRLVTLQLNSGMGRSKVPPAGSVPDVGERLCYTSVLPDNTPSPTLPPVDETPWTHGGPPQPYVPTDDDAREVWE